MQAGGRTDPMGCRIFRSKRAAVFETGSGNRSVRNAQYAYGRAAGSRKTMISERMATILPPLTKKEQLEVSKIYSVCGLLADSRTLLQERPFRSPHHTVSMAGLAGGGRSIRPGEISLAHHGVLFLDELPEFSKSTMEVLRQPLEEHQIHLTRAVGSVTYPSDFYFWHL